jgi:hypothetical protein
LDDGRQRLVTIGQPEIAQQLDVENGHGRRSKLNNRSGLPGLRKGHE